MIKTLWKKCFGKTPNIEQSQTHIQFVFTDNGALDLIAHWNTGHEKIFADIVYAINSGILMEKMILSIKTACEKNGRIAEYEEMLKHLNELYEEEGRLFKQMQENNSIMSEDPIVCPSDVFGGKSDNSLTGEDEEEI